MEAGARFLHGSRIRCKMKRNAFTLVEMLIVITIIAIIAALSMAALLSAAEEGRLARARAQVAKIDQLIGEKWNAYRFRQLPVRIPAGTAPVVASQIRLNVLRELMRMELPDRLTDVTDGPVTTQPIPSVLKAYRRKVTPLAASRLSYDSSEMLYLIISEIHEGDKSALEFFTNSEISDLDEDGMYEILDPWGEPLMFLRWAPGYSRATMNDPVKGNDPLSMYLTAPAPVIDVSVSTFQVPAGQIAPDTFDPLKVDPRWLPSASEGFRPFQLRPLLLSGGPDRKFDIFNDFGDASGNAGHYANTNPPNDPYVKSTTLNLWVGYPCDIAALPAVLPPRFASDNISNHGLELIGE
jgi:prepilin-type N-terminal cleavage/methylation domain-containing protein